MAIQTTSLEETAQALVAPGKGILAADESERHDQEALRLDRGRVHRGEPPRLPRPAVHDRGRRRPHQRRDPVRRDDPPVRRRRHAVPEAAREQGRHPRDQGRHGREAAGHAPGETITEGLDGLRERLDEYRELGASFAKWRAVITIGDGIPSEYCLWTNAHALARYAALCQEAGLVPIVEPEVLMDGDHTIERSFDVTSRTLHAVFTELRDQRVHFEEMLLKPNMVLSGYDASEQASDERDRRAHARAASAATCRPRCRGSSSSPAASPTRTRRRG